MRRRVAAALGALVITAASGPSASPAIAADVSTQVEQLSTDTHIKHFVVLMQANHSFDNYFGTYPGANGIPEDMCMPVDPTQTSGECVEPFHIGGQDLAAMGQDREIHDAQVNGGKMNGFISAFAQRRGVGDQAMGYYDDRDIPFYWNVADNYVLFDNLFASAAGGSFWNHMFWVAGTPGNLAADAPPTESLDDVPTIFDRLQEAGIPWKFYVENYRPEINYRTPGEGYAAAQTVRVPLLNYDRFLDDPELSSRIVDMSQYYKDLDGGTLPAVSFMVPSGSSEHPPGSVQAGERLVRSLVHELMSSSAWDTSAFMWTYDGWGGWYDHVVPPAVDEYGYGFRSPALLVSPYAKKGHVDSTRLDFTSQLKFIEENWGVAPLGERDRAANNITSAFDFDAGPREAALLGRTREQPELPNTRTGAVYVSYGVALLALPFFIAFAARRRGRLPTEAAS
jgi:phospholipase C